MVTQTHHFDLPGLGKIPWRSAWQTIPVFFLGNPMDRGAGRATTYRVTKSQTQLKRLCMCAHAHARAHTHTHTHKLSIFPHFPASAPRAPHHCAPRVSSEQLPPGRARAQACPVPHSPSGEFSDLCLQRARELGLGNVVSVSGLPEVVTPRESLGDNHWNISVLIQCLQ